MKKKYRVILALLLLITIFIQLFPVSDRLNAANEKAAEKQLGPGEYLYLNPKWGEAGDWRASGAKIYFYYETTSGSWKTLKMESDGELLRVKIPDDIKTDGEFLFVRCDSATPDDVSNVWNYMWNQTYNIKWSGANNTNTYNITGFVSNSNHSTGEWAKDVWNGTTSYGGEKLYFIDMDKANPLTSVKAKFSVNGTDEILVNMTKENETLNSYSVTIPEDKEYDKVTFWNSSDELLGSMEILDGDYEPGTKNTYYYKRTTRGDGEIINLVDAYPLGTAGIGGKKLYLDYMDFSMGGTEEIYIQVGTGTKTALTADSSDTEVYSYTIPTNLQANQRTVLTIHKGETKYRFFWNDINKNMITLSGEAAGIFDTYVPLSEGKRFVYFDATLSKLSYEGDTWGGKSFAIPESGKKVWYKAWKNGNSGNAVSGEMTLQQPRERSGNTYKDVWRAEINSEFDRIIFFSGNGANDLDETPKATVTANIPSEGEYKTPCFYADGGDDYVYASTDKGREGYWAEAYTIRDAESNKGSTVVDIPNNGTFKHQRLAYYVPVTLYDYYTDYELNGKNRDGYSYDVNNKNSHHIYQPFRQFNMALSDYYANAGTLSQLYWGNFQHWSYGSDAKPFYDISRTLNLFGHSTDLGSDTLKRFFYQNNSMWGREGASANDMLPNGNNATQGLVSKNLTADGNLQINTNNNMVEAPFFNKEFIEGKNSKNAVLGKVYENVKFPFIQIQKSGLKTVSGADAKGTVDYWSFNSADGTASNRNLRLKQDSNTGEYYLETGDAVKGTTTDNVTKNTNYFPFNDSAQSGNSGTLNYGFGQKMELNFELTEDGTVKTTYDEYDEYVPIEFTFSGDDDMWIFIDGQLVLDVGGDHGIVNGTIDFAKKESTVSGVKNETGNGISSDVVKKFPDVLKNDPEFYEKEHTLTMFYMERGLWESNMHITFNFPDDAVFSVAKEVDTSAVNNIFKSVYADAEFPFNIKNQATHYRTLATGMTTGFGVSQADIPEYSSVASGKLENAVNAIYTLNGSDAEKKVNNEGIFTLKNGEQADFSNQFRRGSYIYLNEDISQDNFKTTWELYDNNEKVTSTLVPDGHINAIGGKILTEEDMVGTVISDGRQESYMPETGIANTGYTKTGPAKIGDSKEDTTDTIVFRSYSEPDSVIGLNLKVKEINTVRAGSVKISKEQAEGSSDLGDTEFEFKVTFTNVSGMNLEGATPIERTIRLKKGASYTLTGIPAGTEYRIEEVAKEGYTLKEVKSEQGNDKDVEVEGAVVTGTVMADDNPDDLQSTSFAFVNTKAEGSIDILKRDAEGVVSGVEFTLYESDGVTIARDSEGKELKALTNLDGKISFRNIPVGTKEEPKVYYLKETKTVKEHIILKEAIEVRLPYEYHAGDVVNGVQVDEDGITNHVTYTIYNDRVLLLPASGRSGIEVYIMIGVILTVTAIGGLFIRARQKEKQQ